jgi:UDP-2,3-diacylglucosamine pyrophosphatase LpxH
VHVRTLFISDVHLGTRTAQADQLLDLLRWCDADVIYLVGDIIDFWRVRRGPHWPQSHNDVLQKLMRKVRKGTRLILIPGNHDEGLRDYAGMRFGGVEIHRDHVHVTAQGRRYVVMHGDEFDVVVRTAKWLALLGDRGYELALRLNTPLNWVRRHFGLGYWSLSAYLKNRVKKAVAFIGAFEEAVAAEARRRAADGIVCGHIHHAGDRTLMLQARLQSGRSIARRGACLFRVIRRSTCARAAALLLNRDCLCHVDGQSGSMMRAGSGAVPCICKILFAGGRLCTVSLSCCP